MAMRLRCWIFGHRLARFGDPTETGDAWFYGCTRCPWREGP